MSSNTTNSNYGTTQPEKGKLPFYHVFSRSSTDSTRSTDALLQKEPKKEQSKASSTKDTSAKAIFNSAYKNSFRPSV